MPAGIFTGILYSSGLTSAGGKPDRIVCLIIFILETGSNQIYQHV
jgi:hypothetical protein